jgi:hypothetical protein
MGNTLTVQGFVKPNASVRPRSERAPVISRAEHLPE